MAGWALAAALDDEANNIDSLFFILALQAALAFFFSCLARWPRFVEMKARSHAFFVPNRFLFLVHWSESVLKFLSAVVDDDIMMLILNDIF